MAVNYLTGQSYSGNPYLTPNNNPISIFPTGYQTSSNGGMSVNQNPYPQVLGTSTSPTNTSNQQPLPQSPQPQPSGPSPEEIARQQYEEQTRNDINTSYSAYESQLNDMLNNGLPQQQQAQQGIINNNYNSGVADLQFQQNQSNNSLDAETLQATKNQTKNLKNIDESMRSMFLAGNNYLGAIGAGSSSAANQYAYAINKLSNQSRGEVMSQTSDIHAEIARRKTNLLDIVANETRKLTTEKDNQLLQLSNWYSQQQTALKQALANGQLQKGQDLANLSKALLQQALNKLTLIDQENAQRRSYLDQWAIGHATNLKQVTDYVQSQGSYNPSLPQYQAFNGQPVATANKNPSPLFGMGTVTSEKKDLFGNPV